MKSLSADIFLGAHGILFDLETRYARWLQGAASAFVDPQGYQVYVDDREQAFKAALAKKKPRNDGKIESVKPGVLSLANALAAKLR